MPSLSPILSQVESAFQRLASPKSVSLIYRVEVTFTPCVSTPSGLVTVGAPISVPLEHSPCTQTSSATASPPTHAAGITSPDKLAQKLATNSASAQPRLSFSEMVARAQSGPLTPKSVAPKPAVVFLKQFPKSFRVSVQQPMFARSHTPWHHSTSAARTRVLGSRAHYSTSATLSADASGFASANSSSTSAAAPALSRDRYLGRDTVVTCLSASSPPASGAMPTSSAVSGRALNDCALPPSVTATATDPRSRTGTDKPSAAVAVELPVPVPPAVGCSSADPTSATMAAPLTSGVGLTPDEAAPVLVWRDGLSAQERASIDHNQDPEWLGPCLNGKDRCNVQLLAKLRSGTLFVRQSLAGHQRTALVVVCVGLVLLRRPLICSLRVLRWPLSAPGFSGAWACALIRPLLCMICAHVCRATQLSCSLC